MFFVLIWQAYFLSCESLEDDDALRMWNAIQEEAALLDVRTFIYFPEFLIFPFCPFVQGQKLNVSDEKIKAFQLGKVTSMLMCVSCLLLMFYR